MTGRTVILRCVHQTVFLRAFAGVEGVVPPPVGSLWRHTEMASSWVVRPDLSSASRRLLSERQHRRRSCQEGASGISSVSRH